MKIKNMKLMLLGLLAVMGVSNAFAAPVLDEAGKSVNGINYQCWTDGTNKYAYVIGVNNQATKAEQETISIPATVTGEKGTYKVVGFQTGWISGIKNVTAVTKSLSIDLTNFTAALANIDGFTKLESLTLTDASTAGKNKKLDLSAAGFNGNLKTLNISGSKIEEIAANGLKNFTALESIDLGKIKTIGANAFDGCSKVKALTVPATVTSVGANAFDNMTALESVTWNSKVNIPASAFAGSTKIKTVKVDNADITTIGSGAFGSTVIESIELIGAKLKTITGAFKANTKLKKCLLAGSVIEDITVDPNLTACAATLEEITFPATLKDGKLPTATFKGFKKVKKFDLSGTKVMNIPANEFQDCTALEEFVFNAATVSVGKDAYSGCTKLATITNLNNDKLTTIGNRAFKATALTNVDLSAAKVAVIKTETFGECAKLETVKLNDKVKTIEEAAFTHCVKLSSLNLEATKIQVLEMLFTSYDGDETAPCDALKSLKLPETLTTVKKCALQMTGLEELNVPASVKSWSNKILQGCLNLKKFIWTDIDPTVSFIGTKTFLGCDKMEEVRFITKTAFSNISDNDFEGNDPERLKVYVNAESYAILVAFGWTPANTKYATLVAEAETEFAFNEKGLAEDGYYYATYYNDQCDTWFPADKFEVFSAVLENSKIILKEASTDAGYYKVSQWDGTYFHEDISGSNSREAVCIVRSKNPKANVEYKYLGAYESTMPTDNALQVTDGSIKPSRLKYQYKLGVKDGQVKFWRITSGTLKDGAVFIESTNPKAPEAIDIVIGNAATGIDAVENIEEAQDGAIYNLQGVQVKKAQKGLYIQNGKKIIVK